MLRRSDMDVSKTISNHSLKWQTYSEVKTERQTISTASMENPFSPKDELQVNISAGGLSDIEIMEYFEKNKNLDSKKQSINELKTTLLNIESDNESIITQIHDVKNHDREAKIRQLLRELEQARDLEKIIFGESLASDKRKTTNHKIELKFEIQSSRMNSNKTEHYTDISRMDFVPRREADPLVVDLGNDGIQTTGVNKGLRFDLNGDNKLEQSSFVKGNDYAIALDKNQNGFIDSGKELFGDQNGSKDGIEELRSYDQNEDGKIDHKDSVFSSLVLVNADRSAKNLTQVGIHSIDLERLEKKGFSSSGDRIKDGLKVNMLDGSTRDALDVYFQYRK